MKKFILNVLLIFFIGCVALLTFGYRKTSEPNTYYKVYLNNEDLGVIKDKKGLETYINKKSVEYKKKYNVKKVHIPNGLEIKKITTYSEDVKSVEDIYNLVYEKEPFTVSGYQFSIKKENETKKVYVLEKDTFKQAVNSMIETFVGKEKYEQYKTKTQAKIQNTGSEIKSVYVDDDITVKEYNIPVTESIYTDSTELAKYLLFGTTEAQATYTVQVGDTISDVAFNNQISVEEFLISNPTFTSEKNLLFPGQEVVIGVMDPQLSVVEEEYSVNDIVSKYKTEIKYDSTKLVGVSEVLQQGEDGLERVSQMTKYVNGTIYYVEPISKEELKAAVNEIVVKGDKYVQSVGSVGDWVWPTNSGYTISSGFTYRINPIDGSRELHGGLDISGTGYGSPIYAATNGVVYQSNYKSMDGNNVCINHNNGYYTCYAHMSKRAVEKGETVERGQIIGYVGQSGWATGPHCHFEVWVGGAPWYGGRRINPWTMYQ